MSAIKAMEMRAALKRSYAWGQAVACAAGDGLVMLPHSIRKTRALYEHDEMGSWRPKSASHGGSAARGTLAAHMRYQGLDLLLALALGATGGAPVQQEGSGAHRQTFIPEGDIAGKFGTLAVDNGVNVDEYPSVKPASMVMSGRMGGALRAGFECIASDLVVDSTVNTQASFEAVTPGATGPRVLMSEGIFRMNAASGAALGPADTIRPSGFVLNFRRTLAGAYALGSSVDTMDEPAGVGPMEISLMIELPRYTHESHIASFQALEPQKLEMVFTGPAIDEDHAYSLTLRFPSLAWRSALVEPATGVLSQRLEFVCLMADTAPAGMDGLTDPLELALINREALDVLA